jgi:hypothetical protein
LCRFPLDILIRESALRAFQSLAGSLFRWFAGPVDVPSERVADRAVPMSIPVTDPDGPGGSGISRPVWSGMKIPEPVASAVPFLGATWTLRLPWYRTQPRPGRMIRPFPSSSRNRAGLGNLKESRAPLRRDTGNAGICRKNRPDA